MVMEWGMRCLAIAAALTLGVSLEARAEAGNGEDGKSKWGYYLTDLAGGSWASADAVGATLRRESAGDGTIQGGRGGRQREVWSAWR